MSLARIVSGGELPPEVAAGVESAGGARELARRLAPKAQLAAKAKYHRALSDETRLRIMHALLITDLCPCVLKEIAGTSDSKLSYHLKILENERLIAARRVKNWRVYSITKKGRASLAGDGAQSR